MRSQGLSRLLNLKHVNFSFLPRLSPRSRIKSYFKRLNRIELLESRELLAASSLIISEFMAKNSSSLVDEVGDFSDWIEIHNTTDAGVDLSGWSLTDDSAQLSKWEFPDLELGSGEFLILFASGKNRLQTPLHTNFKLDGEGEFLALVDPNEMIAQQFSPEFPPQVADVSFGIPFKSFELLSAGEVVDVHVPLDDSLTSQWTEKDFMIDPSVWEQATLPVGFGVSLPERTVQGFSVRDVRSSSRLSSLTDAENLLQNGGISETVVTGVSVINFSDAEADGNFENDDPFPDSGGSGFAIHALATLVVNEPGLFTFGTTADDGTRLIIDGNVIIEDDTGVGASEVLSSVSLTAGTHSLDLVMYERGRGAEIELYAAAGQHESFSNEFQLLGSSELTSLDVFALTGDAPVTDISAQMLGINSSAYLRLPFEISPDDSVEQLFLRMQYDDGFIAYINGREIARRNAPDLVAWNSTASVKRSVEQVPISEDFEISDVGDLLIPGDNVLAVQLLNADVNNESLLAAPQLLANGLFVSELRPFDLPTPGLANSGSLLGLLDSPQISGQSGYQDEPVLVEIAHSDPEATIRYTLDSSRPSPVNGFDYTKPFLVDGTTIVRTAAFKPKHISSSIETRTLLFLDDILKQDGAEQPQTWGTFSNAFPNGVPTGDIPRPLVGDPVPANYEVDPEIVEDPRYRDTIRDDLNAIPILSLVMDPDDLWDPEIGIYSNMLASGLDWERPVSVELVDTQGVSQFQVEAGVRMHGGFGRRPSATAKHSFRLLFKNIYGPNRLEYPWFGDEATDSFETIVLRAGYNFTWARGERNNTQSGADSTYVQDRWASVLQNEMGGLAPHGDWVHLYVNGLYWGMYNPNERPSAPFLADYQGGSKEDYDVLKIGEVIDGTGDAWNELLALIRQADLDYEAVRNMVDIDGFIDYLIINHYGGNTDWPQNNWYASRRREPGAKWLFHSWDAEFMFQDLTVNAVNRNSNGSPGEIYFALRDHEEFRLRFADRIQKHFFNGGLLTPQENIARFDSLVAPIDRAVVGESARWGDALFNNIDPPFTRDDHWLPRLNELREVFFPQRTEIVLEQYRSVGLYPSIDTPVFVIGRDARHGGQLSPEDLIKIEGGGGRGAKVIYTLDGSDPRLPDGSENPDALIYTQPIQLTESSVVKVRVFQSRIWSALLEAQFLINAPATAENLAVTEIHYNPADPSQEEFDAGFTNNDDFEFIELKNVSEQIIDLAGVRFTEGIDYDFTGSNSIRLTPGEHIVVVNNITAFESRYGNEIPVAGQFTSGRLSNDGELIQLVDRDDEIIQEFSYNDNVQWPAEADGQGNSLVVIDSSGDYDDGGNWRSSIELGGSPGSDGAVPVDLPPFVLDVSVSSSRWSAGFADNIAGLGAVASGFSIVNGLENPQESLPWSNLDTIHVVFSEDVTLAESDLELFGVNVADYVAEVGFLQNSFSYDDATFTATWSLAGSLAIDKLSVGFSNNIRDTLGNPLSGDAEFRFSVLPGDANRSGDVDLLDVQTVRDAILLGLNDPAYNVMIDFDGSGSVDIRDVQTLRINMLAALPVDEPLVGQVIEAAMSTEQAIEFTNKEELIVYSTGVLLNEKEAVLLLSSKRRSAGDFLLAQEQTSLTLLSDGEWPGRSNDTVLETSSWEDLVDQTLDDSRESTMFD